MHKFYARLLKGVALATLASAVMAAGSAQAAAMKVFSSFGAGNSNSGYGDCITGADSPGCFTSPTVEWIAASFVPSKSGALDYIHVAMNYGSGTPGFVVSLVSDNGGSPGGPTAVLETYVVTKASQYSTYEKLMSTAHPTLTKGVTYWLVMSPLAYDSDSSWYLSPTNTSNPVISTNAGISWGSYSGDPPYTNLPAFDVWIE